MVKPQISFPTGARWQEASHRCEGPSESRLSWEQIRCGDRRGDSRGSGCGGCGGGSNGNGIVDMYILYRLLCIHIFVAEFYPANHPSKVAYYRGF